MKDIDKSSFLEYIVEEEDFDDDYDYLNNSLVQQIPQSKINNLSQNDRINRSNTFLFPNFNYFEDRDVLIKYDIEKKEFSPLKTYFINLAVYFHGHYFIFTLIKFLFGFILLLGPIVYYVALIDVSEEKVGSDFRVFPFFLSICLILGCTVLLFIFNLTDGFYTNSILLPSWDRINIIKTFNTIVLNLFLLWIAFSFDTFIQDLPSLKESIKQHYEIQSTQRKLVKGSYTYRLLFIFLFWEKGENGQEINQYLSYFTYDRNFLNKLQTKLNNLIRPILVLSIVGLIKIILIKAKHEIIWFILYLIATTECFLLILYDLDDEQYNQGVLNEEDYFPNSGCRYFEVICFSAIICIFIYFSFVNYFLQIRKGKYNYSLENKDSDERKYNIIIKVILIGSFIITVVGNLILLILVLIFFFSKIDEYLTYDTFNTYLDVLHASIILISLGWCFLVGDYYSSLVFYSVFFEHFPYKIKGKKNHIMSSMNLARPSHNSKKYIGRETPVINPYDD